MTIIDCPNCGGEMKLGGKCMECGYVDHSERDRTKNQRAHGDAGGCVSDNVTDTRRQGMRSKPKPAPEN